MITIVIAGYAALMLTIVLAVFGAAARSTPKPPAVVFDEIPVRRGAKPVFKPITPTATNGGSEVLAFEV
jgi:hypothetical protein